MNALHYFVYKALLDKNVDIHSIGSHLNEGVGQTGLKKEIGFEFTREKVIRSNKVYNPIKYFEVKEGMMRELIQYMKTPSTEFLPAR